MSAKKGSEKKKSLKDEKISKYTIDVLAVYRSSDANSIPLEEALSMLREDFSVKNPPKIRKCIMQIWKKSDESIYFDIKSKEKRKILETFNIESLSPPTISQLKIGKFDAQSLVFLPMLNSSNISEMYIFHPVNVTAQEVVITIAKLMENNRNSSPNTIKSNGKSMSNGKTNNINQDDNRSLCSISSQFINNWFSKLDTISPLQPNSNSSLASVNEELYMLNQNMKEIRVFMNSLFQTIHSVMHNKKMLKKTNGTVVETIRIPPKGSFISIVEKIKACFNLAATHEDIIINPSSSEIVNQLFLFLRIIGDITLNELTGTPDLVSNVASPTIISSTVKFFINNLNNDNNKYWSSLGSNFGYLNSRSDLPGSGQRNFIDEFQVRKTPQMFDYEEKEYGTMRKKYQTNNFNRFSPTPFVNDETIRSFPRIYEPENKPPLFTELQYQKPISYSTQNNWRIHSNHSAWGDRQCRFIDAVQLRNGRLGKAIHDRSVQNYRELSVSCNEVVEIMKDFGDRYSIKNALGEIGDCPKAIIHEIGQL